MTETSELLAFAARAGFPAHALILRPPGGRDVPIHKGIVDHGRLLQVFGELRAAFSGVSVETDMRAMHNPTCMAVIAHAASALIASITRIQRHTAIGRAFPDTRIFSSMTRTLKAAFILLSVPVLLSLPAAAQDDADAAAVAATSGLPSAAGAMRPGWRNQWGVGFIANPKFVGGDDYNTRVIPYVDLRYFDENGTRFFANVPQGIGGYALRLRDPASGEFLNIGGSIAPGFNVRDDSIEGLDEVGLSTEARLLLEAGGRRWAASATLAQDFGSGHEGTYLDLSLALRGRLGTGSGFYAVGPVLRVGDSRYKDALFGVTPADSIETGLPAYDADAGVERLGLQGLASLPVRRSKWRFTALLRASRLLDNAADSPIVVDETQFFFITAFTRAF